MSLLETSFFTEKPNERRKDFSRLRQVGLYLKGLRLNADLSQDELAARCDLTKSNISNIENGKKDYFLTTFLEYAKGPGMQPRELLSQDFNFTIKY